MTTMPLTIFTQDKNDSWYTPKWIFDAIGITFDLDVACPPQGPLHVPTKQWLTEKEDGLTSPWHGTIWMNPPYSKPLPWVQKFIDHNNGIALMPTTNGKWHQMLWEAETTWVQLPPTKFENNTGQAKAAFPTRCWLIAAGDKARKALANSGISKPR